MINERCARKFCKDDISKIENYDKAIADTTQTWHCHHRLELTLDGEFAHSRDELIRLDMYYNRPYFELIFVTKSEHSRMHNNRKSMSVETCRKLSETHKGNNCYMFGKHHSEETKRKMIAKKQGSNHPMYGRHHTEESRRKMSEARREYWANRNK